MVKDTLLFVVVGCDFGRAQSLKHRALGHPVEILASGSKLLSYEPGRGLHLEERQSFFQISCPKPLSPQGQAWLLLEQGNQPVSICAPCVSEQKPSVVLGGLCLSRQPGPVGEPQGWLSWCRAVVSWVGSSILTHWFFTRFALFPAPGSCSCRAWQRISRLPPSSCIAHSWLFVAANDLLQRVLWKVKHYPVVCFFILPWKTASKLLITWCKIFIVLEILVNTCCKQQYKYCLQPCEAF